MKKYSKNTLLYTKTLFKPIWKLTGFIDEFIVDEFDFRPQLSLIFFLCLLDLFWLLSYSLDYGIIILMVHTNSFQLNAKFLFSPQYLQVQRQLIYLKTIWNSNKQKKSFEKTRLIPVKWWLNQVIFFVWSEAAGEFRRRETGFVLVVVEESVCSVICRLILIFLCHNTLS